MSDTNPEQPKDQFEVEENQQECAKVLNELFEVKKVKKLIEMDPKRRVNIGKLIKSVANCYDCKVSKFNETDKLSTDDEANEGPEEDFYEVELKSNQNRITILDKRSKRTHDLNLTEFRNFLENKFDVKTDMGSTQEGAANEEEREEKKFHFLKFELILREFYKKNEIRMALKNNYKTNEIKKANIGFSYVKQPVGPHTYQGKSLAYASPAIKKNFFEDHKEEIKKAERRKTQMYENNQFDKLKNDLDATKVPNTQIPKFTGGLDQVKEDKVSPFTANVEESKEKTDSSQHKSSIKMMKRTSIFNYNIDRNLDEEPSDDEEDENGSDTSQE